MMLKITCRNPYCDVRYTTDLTLVQWKGMLAAIENGNIDIVNLFDLTSKCFVSISPKNWASIEVIEEKQDEV